MFDAIFYSQIHKIPGTHHIIQYRLLGVFLHQRYMFMSGSMKNNLRVIFPEDPLHGVVVPHIVNSDFIFQIAVGEVNLINQLMNAVFATTQQYTLFRFKSGQLPDNFRTDRSSRSRDQNNFLFDIIFDRGHVQLHRLSSKKITDIHIPDLIDSDLTAYQVINAGYDLVMHTGGGGMSDRKSTRRNSSHVATSYAVFCSKKKKNKLLILSTYVMAR